MLLGLLEDGLDVNRQLDYAFKRSSSVGAKRLIRADDSFDDSS
jgi:hypothetical protein